ncbi:hexokinase-1 [Hyalella azteca]|uniref:Phosphotransferase n=1 Tax=Hyalella azteca TaxID=294128 RepID=A0A8B7PFK8_HYAAZ|nr:hexokinase-1 [Hyalella azteca]XP_018024785.1 hexokinase-1 [Hyalella azteca]
MANSPLELPVLTLDDVKLQKRITSRLSCLVLGESHREHLKEVFVQEMARGLEGKPSEPSSLFMEDTFLPDLPNGKEEGDFLALDLGGTNLRVLLITLKAGQVTDEILEYYTVPECIRYGHGSALFDFLASSVESFLKKRNLNSNKYNMGFTFSFPIHHRSLRSGELIKWSKSFNCPGVVGQDVVALLEEALARRKLDNIAVVAILNDTTGTMVRGAYLDHQCAMGLVLGTGSNCCYVEKPENFKKQSNGNDTTKLKVLNVEWGAFGDNGVLNFMRTQWDISVDRKSLLAGSFTFEKYFGGKCLGDLVRECLVTLAEEGLFCTGPSETLRTVGSLHTSQVSTLDGEGLIGRVKETEEILQALGLCYTEKDVKIAQYVAGLFSYRGVVLISVLTATLLQKMERPHVVIAIDGSLYEFHPRFRPLMIKLIGDMAPDHTFELRLSRDGSGKGAALVAAIASRCASE